MNSIKCPNCGFVSWATGTCRNCGGQPSHAEALGAAPQVRHMRAKSASMSMGKKILLGFFILIVAIVGSRPLIQELWNPNLVGDELLAKYSAKYSVIGKKAVDKEIGGPIIGTQMVPALFIYLLQDRSDQDKLLVVVSQSYGYSIGKITIGGSALNNPITVAGGGKFWGNYIQPHDRRPTDMFYETQAVVSNRKDGDINITVTYFWIWRGPGVEDGTFEDRSDTTNAVFQLSP